MCPQTSQSYLVIADRVFGCDRELVGAEGSHVHFPSPGQGCGPLGWSKAVGLLRTLTPLLILTVLKTPPPPWAFLDCFLCWLPSKSGWLAF